MIKKGKDYNDIYNYRNSKYFIKTVQEARKYDLLNKIKRMYPNMINNSNVLKLFRRRCQHIADGLEGRLGKKKGNICVSKIMDDYCEMERQQLREQREGMVGKRPRS